MEEIREKIKTEIVGLFGEKVYQIFANNQGSPNDSEFLESLTFQEVISLNSNLYLKALDNLIYECEESNLLNVVDFLDSFRKFLKLYHDKNPFFTELEKSFGSNEYKKLLKNKSIEIFDSNDELFLKETFYTIRDNQKIKIFFIKEVCKGINITEMEESELKIKISDFSKVCIINILRNEYIKFRNKPLIDFNYLITSEDNLIDHTSEDNLIDHIRSNLNTINF